MRWAYGSGRDNLSGKEFLLLFTPCALGVFAYGVEEFYKSAYEKASTKSIYDLPGRSLLMILYYLACYLTILVVVQPEIKYTIRHIGIKPKIITRRRPLINIRQRWNSTALLLPYSTHTALCFW